MHGSASLQQNRSSPGITSCSLMKDNNQQVDLTCLMKMTWPKDVIDK